MIEAGIALLAALAADPATGVAAGRQLLGLAAPVVIRTELDSAAVARYQLPDPADPDVTADYGTSDAPQLLLVINQATAVDLPVAAETLVGAPGVVYALTAACLDDGGRAAHVCATDLYGALRAAARAVTLPFTRARGARPVLEHDGVLFSAPTVTRIVTRHADPSSVLMARTLLVTMAGVDPFLVRPPA